MTGRERLNTIMHKQPVDRLSWTTLVDWSMLSTLSEPLQQRGGMAFYEYLGCDVMLLDGWGSPYPWQSPKLQWPADVCEESRQDGEDLTQEWHTPFGTLTARTRGGRYLKHQVETSDDLRIYRSMWENAEYVAINDGTTTAQAIDAFIGDSGIHVRYWWPSVVQWLLQFVTGIENFYYLLADCRTELEDLMAVMHSRELKAFEILARCPLDTIILPENTSTMLISPELYRRYSLPQVRDFVDIVHSEKKVALLHMCGHVFDLMHLIKETGTDGIHGLTPPSVGNTPWEYALDILGDDAVIIGVLEPDAFCNGTPEDIHAFLDMTYTPRLRRSHFCLWAAADGIRVPLDNFLAVKSWMERQ